jgi:primosomal protein N' (replication factor Y)
MSLRLVDVALPLPFQSAFSYRVPDALPLPARGARVVVPFGTRRVIGVVLGPATTAREHAALKDVLDVLDIEPLVGAGLLDLAAWLSEHYLAPPGECYRLVLPPAGVRSSRAVVRLAEPPAGARSADPDAEQRTQAHLWQPDEPAPAGGGDLVRALRAGPLPLSTLAHRLGGAPRSSLQRLRRAGQVAIEQDLRTGGFRLVRVAVLLRADDRPKGRAQQALIQRLRDAGGRQTVPTLLHGQPSWRAALTKLVLAGSVAIEEQREARQDEFEAAATLSLPEGALGRPQPTLDQGQAIDELVGAVEAATFAPFLLHGITGSGKTEVYFRAAEAALARGRSALFMVPEIALTPLLVRAAVARFGRAVSVLHSELSVGERHDHWWRIRDGVAPIVIGARSALFAPLPRLGLIVVDEEHEAAYKQEESPRYHARDAAVVRARLEGAPIVLGSATPSVESYANALKGKYRVLRLPSRVAQRALPQVCIVDRRETLRQGEDALLTPALRLALERRLERREQALLLLNRRGYATSLLCRECGAQAECPNCSVNLALHDGGRVAVCHYCGHQVFTPERCATCRGAYLTLSGYGTERVVEALHAALPRARVERVDRDLAGRRGALRRVLQAFEAGDLDVLVGTQMIAKGHDFPRVTLVGVIDADVGLGLPDFRAAERAFQLLTQVAGRAGRGDWPGEVILQSHMPDHYVLQWACDQDYAAFYGRESEFRRTMGYPPTSALLNLIVRARDPEQGSEHADALAQALRAVARRFRVLGPARAPLARLRQEHRFQILLKGDRASMRAAVRQALVARFGTLRWPGIVVDVDPVSVM